LLSAISTAFGQDSRSVTPATIYDKSAPHRIRAGQFLRGRSLAAARLAHPESVAQALDAARKEHLALLAQLGSSALSAPWTAVGPGQIATASYGNVTGRVTSVAIDPADASGNTVYVGTTGGGVWKSTNAAGPAAAVSFVPLTDTLPVFSANAGTAALPSLSIGALAVSNGVVLAGTGDPNDATDSYYGAGILRSADGGVTWTLIQATPLGLGGSFSFFGLGFAGFAFSSATPSLVVAAVSQAAEGALVNAPAASYTAMGLYYSADAGATWQMATVMDGAQTLQSPTSSSAATSPGNAATAVVWNPVRQRFFAAIRFHGYYQSADGVNWTRLAAQPGTGLTLVACPTNPGLPGNSACPIFRGALAVQAASGDTFALSTDVNNLDQGLWQDVCAVSGSACGNAAVSFATRLPSGPLEIGNGSTEILQADYDLDLAVVPVGTDTLVYAGTVDLYRCSVAAGCVLRNTTNAQNGCAAPAMVAPAQHAISVLGAAGGPLVYLGNDGGLWRSTDGVAETGPACSASDASHFENLNGGLGSLAEVVSFAQHPTDPATLLVGVGANGTAGTGAAATSAWGQLATGEGGTVAIDPTTPSLWYLSTAAGVSIGRCASGSACTAADFAGPATIGEAQVANDISAIDAPWLLDPALTSDVLIGTCRAWRGPAASGASWTSSNTISRPFGAATGTACGTSLPVVRTLAAGGAPSAATAAQDAGSTVLYAGLAGTLDGGATLGGHLFTTKAAGTASATTVWTDAATSPVTNDLADAGVFNPQGFDISSLAADPHDATGATLYATVMGFSQSGSNAPHVYRTVDFGAHWTNISSNLPDAPANSVVVDPNDANTVYVALDTGVYVTTQVTGCTSTQCWSVYGVSLPNAPVAGLAAATGMATGDGRSGELRAATYGRGIWEIPLLTAANPAAPALFLAPAALTFATQQVGTASAAQTVTVTNTGNASMTVSSLVASGDFNETDTCVSAPIAAGASCVAQVTFLPGAAGTRSGLLTVYANVPGGQGTVTLNGTGAPAASIVLTPVALSFPATAIGAASAVQNITVSNTGGITAALQTPSITGDFSISANSCGSTLAASSGCTVSIVFTPTASGTRSGVFTLTDAIGTQTASLTGNGTAPATDSLAPLSLTFSGQVLNTASPTQAVTLTNAGDVALTLIAAQIASGDYTVVNGCGNSLSAHANCTLLVAFAPKSIGVEAGVLSVSDQFRTQRVALSGTGLAPAGVSLSPVGSMSFPATAVGSSSVIQTVTLTNNGGVALTLESVAITSNFAIVAGTNTCGTTIGAATACTLGVDFVPGAGGAFSGALTFVDSAGSSPQTLALSGAGVDFTLAPNGPTSATLSSGGSATYPLLLSSVAGVPGSVVFTCSGLPPGATCTITPPAPALGAVTTISVAIATGVSGAMLQSPMRGWLARGVKGGIWAACLAPLLALRRRRRLAGLVCMSVLFSLAGCGWGRLIPGDGIPTAATVTPTGAYTIVVTASSTGIVKSVNLTLIVQ
jgi:hypothetical protein